MFLDHSAEFRIGLRKLLAVERQLMSNTRLSVANSGAALHYTDSNAFSRALPNWARASPRQWRVLDRKGDIEAVR